MRKVELGGGEVARGGEGWRGGGVEQVGGVMRRLGGRRVAGGSQTYMLMYMTSVQSSSVAQRNSVSMEIATLPKCAGSFSPKHCTATTANM